MRFQTEEKCIEAIRDRIQDSASIPPQMKDYLCEEANRFSSKEPQQRSPGFPEPRMMGFMTSYSSAGFYFVIRNEDLNLIEAVSQIAKDSADSFNANQGTSTAHQIALAVKLMLDVADQIKSLRKKRIPVDEDDYKLLHTLKQLGPSTTSELAMALGGMHIFQSQPLTPNAVRQKLLRLQAVTKHEGSIVERVGVNRNQKWSVAGI